MQVSMHLFAASLEERGVDFDAPAIPGQQFAARDLTPIIGGYDAMIAGDDEVNASVLKAGLPRLKTVAKWGIGVDGIDLAAAADLGITVTNTPGMFDDEVADVAYGYVLSLLRGLHEIDRAVRAGDWRKIAGRSTRGLTLGVVGLGGTGRAVAIRGLASGMQVIGTELSPTASAMATDLGVTVTTFEEVLATADIVSLHCPLTPQTEKLMSAAAISAMKPGAYLVNTSRGRVVEEQAVVDALSSGQLAGAALDVFEEEPLPAKSPLRSFGNVILGSHNASNTQEAVIRTSAVALQNALTSIGVA